MRLFLFVISWAVLFSSNVHANWLYSENESAFGSDTISFAVTASRGYGLGLRCVGDKPELLFITTEAAFDADALVLANGTGPKVLFRVDSLPVRELDAEILDSDGKAAALAEVDSAVFQEVRDARKRVSVALKLITGTYHETKFNVRNSTKSVGQLMEKCGSN